jgi:hypothetical protein
MLISIGFAMMVAFFIVRFMHEDKPVFDAPLDVSTEDRLGAPACYTSGKRTIIVGDTRIIINDENVPIFVTE